MALIAVAADKGAPGVTTAAVALAAVWPRPVLLAECDPAGGDLIYRLPAADGGRLDPRQGLLSLAVASRRGLQPHQVWEHTQKLHGGLDILTGVSGAEQGAGLELLWGSVGRLLAAVPQADVIADCGRVGVDGPIYDLLAQASTVVLLSRLSLGEVIRLRDRAGVVAAALSKRGRSTGRLGVVVVTDYKNFGSATAEVGQALRQSGAPARVFGGLAYEPKSAEQLRGEWSGKLDKSMFIRTARAIAADLVTGLPDPEPASARSPGTPAQPVTPGPAGAPSPSASPAPARPPGPAGPGGAPGPAGTSGPAPLGPRPAQPSYPAGPARPAPDQQRYPAAPAPGRPPYPAPPGPAYPDPPARGVQRPSGTAQPYTAPEGPPRPPSAAPPSGLQPSGPRAYEAARSLLRGATPGGATSRGRHAGPAADPKAADQQPGRGDAQPPPPEPESAGPQQAVPLLPLPEPTSGTPQGRPRGR